MNPSGDRSTLEANSRSGLWVSKRFHLLEWAIEILSRNQPNWFHRGNIRYVLGHRLHLLAVTRRASKRWLLLPNRTRRVLWRKSFARFHFGRLQRWYLLAAFKNPPIGILNQCNKGIAYWCLFLWTDQDLTCTISYALPAFSWIRSDLNQRLDYYITFPSCACLLNQNQILSNAN